MRARSRLVTTLIEFGCSIIYHISAFSHIMKLIGGTLKDVSILSVESCFSLTCSRALRWLRNDCPGSFRAGCDVISAQRAKKPAGLRLNREIFFASSSDQPTVVQTAAFRNLFTHSLPNTSITAASLALRCLLLVHKSSYRLPNQRPTVQI